MNQAADAIFVADPQRMEYLDANEAAGRLVGPRGRSCLQKVPSGWRGACPAARRLKCETSTNSS